MGFVILTILSTIVSGLLFWIGKGWLSIIPLCFLGIYSMDRIGQFSFASISRHSAIKYSALFSWLAIIAGIIILLGSQGFSLDYGGLIILINTILLIISYSSNYQEGKSIFLRGLILSRITSVFHGIRQQNIDLTTIMTILTGGTCRVIIVWTGIIQRQGEQATDNDQLHHYREVAVYILIYLLIYRLLADHYLAVIVLGLRSTTLLIMIRQQFLSYQSGLKQEKNTSLSARALLQGQKVLIRYESKQDRLYSLMSTLSRAGVVPSSFGLGYLQIMQGIQIILLVSLSARQLRHGGQHVLLRYRSGVICFVVSLFGLDRQERFFEWYKKFALIILSGAFYLTLFDSTALSTSFVRGSLARSLLNMFCCLFYDTLVPLSKRILTRHDLIFWMLWSNCCTIITIATLTNLALPGDVLFALICIILGLTSFFSYHIWKKYRN